MHLFSFILRGGIVILAALLFSRCAILGGRANGCSKLRVAEVTAEPAWNDWLGPVEVRWLRHRMTPDEVRSFANEEGGGWDEEWEELLSIGMQDGSFWLFDSFTGPDSDGGRGIVVLRGCTMVAAVFTTWIYDA